MNFYTNLIIYIIILTMLLLSNFFSFLGILVEVLKVAKTLTFETKLILFSNESGVFLKSIAIE